MDVQIVSFTSSEITIATLRHIFATHGLPEHLVSDNAPGFTSAEFKLFMQQNGIKHILTSPYHPSSNGLMERAVQTFKTSVSKLEGSMEDRLIMFLFKYRVTPQTTTGLSPAQLLMGRRLRTRLDLLHPDISQKVMEKQQKLVSSKTPHRFQVGDKLFARNFHDPQWIPVKVTRVTGPLSGDSVLRRYVDHLRFRYSDGPLSTQQSDASDDWTMPDAFTNQPDPLEQSEPAPDSIETLEGLLPDLFIITGGLALQLIDTHPHLKLKRGGCGNPCTLIDHLSTSIVT